MNPVDLRAAFRQIRRQPGIAIVAVLALGLGIGLPAAMFSVVRAMTLRGLPVPDGAAIMHMERRPIGARGEGWGVAPRDWFAWQELRSFDGIGAFDQATVAMRIDAGADRYEAARLTGRAFEILRVPPVLGRTIGPADALPGAEPVVVLAHHVWRDRFASDPGAIGRTVTIDGRPYTVIGVMPEGFRFPIREDLWTPFVIPPGAEGDATFPDFDVFGRLRDGVSRADAAAELNAIAARLADQYPETNADMGVTVKRFTDRHMGENAVQTMWVILVAVMLVLAVACTNVANLLLVRAVQRIRELAVRAALGARRGRIISQLLHESLALAVLGGGLGVVIAIFASRGLADLIGSDRMPYWVDIRLDGMTLVFTGAITLLAALIAGMLPAVKAMRVDVANILKDETRGGSGMRIGRAMQGLVVLEIALSFGLLVATGLMVRSLQNVRDVPLGFATRDVLTAQFAFPETLTDEERLRFASELERRMADVSGTTGITVATNLPTTRAPVTRFALEGSSYVDEDAMPRVRRVAVSGGFFDALGIRPTAGRSLNAQDQTSGQPVVVVNERFVARFFGGENPLGRQVRLGGLETPNPWRTVVGVVPDVWAAGLDASGDRNPPAVYIPLAGTAPAILSLAVRSAMPAQQLAARLRETAAATDPAVALFDVKPMTGVVDDNSWFYGMGAAIVGTCGFSALLLAVVGLYGVVAFSVNRRTREFGIRTALGATPRRIIHLVLRRAGWQLGLGMLLGTGLAVALGRGVASLLFNVQPTDAAAFVGFGSILVLAALFATLIPALRASRIDPLTALRQE